MARPRTPSTVLEARDAFRKHPERSREDIAGVGEIGSPPAYLTPLQAQVWEEIVFVAPPGVFTATDRLSLEAICRLAAFMRETGSTAQAAELRQWLGQYGFTAAARAKISAPAKPKASEFAEFAN